MLKSWITNLEKGNSRTVLEALEKKEDKLLKNLENKSVGKTRQCFAMFLVLLADNRNYKDQKLIFDLWAKIKIEVPQTMTISIKNILLEEFTCSPWNGYQSRVNARLDDIILNNLWFFSKFSVLQSLEIWNCFRVDVPLVKCKRKSILALCAWINMFGSMKSTVNGIKFMPLTLNQYCNTNLEVMEDLYLKGSVEYIKGTLLLNHLQVEPQASSKKYIDISNSDSQVQAKFVSALKLWERAYQERKELDPYTARSVLSYALSISYYFRLNGNSNEFSALKLLISLSKMVEQDKYFILGVAELLHSGKFDVPENWIKRASKLVEKYSKSNYYYCLLFKIAHERYIYHFEEEEMDSLIQLKNTTCEDPIVELRKLHYCLDLQVASSEEMYELASKLVHALNGQTAGLLKIQWLIWGLFFQIIGEAMCVCIYWKYENYVSHSSFIDMYLKYATSVGSPYWICQLQLFSALSKLTMIKLHEAKETIEEIKAILLSGTNKGDKCHIISQECICQKCYDIQHIDFSLQLLCLEMYCSVIQKELSPPIINDASRVMSKLKSMIKKENNVITFSISLFFQLYSNYLIQVNDFNNAFKCLKKAERYLPQFGTLQEIGMLSEINCLRMEIVQNKLPVDTVKPFPLEILEETSSCFVKMSDLTWEMDSLADESEIDCNETSYYEEVINERKHKNSPEHLCLVSDSRIYETVLESFVEPLQKTSDITVIDALLGDITAQIETSHLPVENDELNTAFIDNDDVGNETLLT